MKSIGQQITEQVCGEIKMKVGAKIKHPDGRLVKITSGQAWSNGRLSNFWHWREVLPDGKLGKDESGYGWC